MNAFPSLTALAASTLLGGCIIIDADERDLSSDLSPDRAYGTVYGAQVHQDEVSFQVSSNGCTDEDSFRTQTASQGARRFEVAIERVRADNCRAFIPGGVSLSYSFAELGLPEGADVTVLNPVRRR